MSPQPTWEAYYKYAQQLFAAGYQREAEAYYQQAKLLFDQAERQQASQYPEVNRSVSYSSPQPNDTMANGPVVFTVRNAVTEDLVSAPAINPKRSPKKRVKIWVATGLVVGLVVSVSGFFGLFYLYKSEMRRGISDGTSDGISDSSLLGKVRGMTLDPMVDALQPVFDKTIRLSLAVQPLLYELNIRDALPQEYYLKMLASAETLEEIEAKSVSSLETPTAARADESVEEAESLAGGQADSDRTLIASNIEVQEVKTNTRNKSSSLTRLLRSNRHKSSRSARRRKSEDVSNDVKEIEPPPPPETASSVETAPPPVAPPSVAPPPVAPPPSASTSKTKELDALLKPKDSVRSSSNNSAAKSTSIKDNLSRSDVQQGMARVAPAVKRCGQGRGGTISMNVVIGQNGRISSVVAAGVYAGTPIGACAERAVRRAGFPASRKSITVKYPFKL